MALSSLGITQFRNLLSVNCEPIAGFNLICGENGSGKTSFLEAIHLLSVGRSFRCSQIERMINDQAEHLSVFAQINQQGQAFSVGCERKKDKSSKIRLDGKDQASVAPLAQLMPIRVINSQSYQLLDGGPLFRRKYLDWGVFYLKKDFLRVWQQFERALKQRNAALKNHLSAQEVGIWTEELVKWALQLDEARRAYINDLMPVFNGMLKQLLEDTFEVEMIYSPGWDNTLHYEAVLANAYPKETYVGYTQFGPHKADLKIQLKQGLAKDFLSRGQQKLLVCAMLLAQGKLLFQLANKQPIFLMDDLPSELDNNNLERVMALLTQQQAQVFITAIDPSSLRNFVGNSAVKVFHVEQGAMCGLPPHPGPLPRGERETKE